MTRKRPQWAVWVALMIGVATALAIGARGPARATTLYQRTLQIAGQYRCPVCAGESAAASDAPEAVQIRKLVEKWLAAGRSPAQIHSYLVAYYGSSILERPPASGFDALVWLLPVAGVTAAGAGLCFGFARWRRAGRRATVDTAQLSSARGRARGFGGVEMVALGARAGRSWLSGTARTGAKLLGRPVLQRAALATGIALMALAGALFVLDRTSSPRLAGETISGGATGTASELQQAFAMAAKDPAGALKLYDKVLTADPGQPVALTSEGWIYARAGFTAKGLTLLAEAETADPGYDLAHLYRGLVLEGEGRRHPAALELKWYLSHGPDAGLVKLARSALAQLGA
jgi:cytochrome c-type biogenesis protein CcmH